MAFERRFQVGWNNLDANAHMANTAYLEMGANVGRRTSRSYPVRVR